MPNPPSRLRLDHMVSDFWKNTAPAKRPTSRVSHNSGCAGRPPPETRTPASPSARPHRSSCGESTPKGAPDQSPARRLECSEPVQSGLLPRFVGPAVQTSSRRPRPPPPNPPSPHRLPDSAPPPQSDPSRSDDPARSSSTDRRNCSPPLQSADDRSRRSRDRSRDKAERAHKHAARDTSRSPAPAASRETACSRAGQE